MLQGAAEHGSLGSPTMAPTKLQPRKVCTVLGKGQISKIGRGGIPCCRVRWIGPHWNRGARCHSRLDFVKKSNLKKHAIQKLGSSTAALCP